jgi:uncharacterized protein (TIGR02301 family)
MRYRPLLPALFSGLLLVAIPGGEALAQDAVEPDQPAASGEQPAAPAELPPPIYEDKLLRLAEILGSLSFLRDLCGASDGPSWRREMAGLLAAEKPSPARRSRLIARFNHGFETYNAVYRVCTPSAERAVKRYLTEGQALASDVRSRYSQ